MQRFVVLLKTLFMAACAVALFGVITWQLQRLDPFIPITLPHWTSVGGIVLMVAGAILGFTCFGLFSANGALSRHAHFPDPEVFISWGPYQYVRYPMAEGGWAVLCGWGFFQLSPSILLFVVVMAVFLHLFVVYLEERSWSNGSGRVTASTSAGLVDSASAIIGRGSRLTSRCSRPPNRYAVWFPPRFALRRRLSSSVRRVHTGSVD